MCTLSQLYNTVCLKEISGCQMQWLPKDSTNSDIALQAFLLAKSTCSGAKAPFHSLCSNSPDQIKAMLDCTSCSYNKSEMMFLDSKNPFSLRKSFSSSWMIIVGQWSPSWQLRVNGWQQRCRLHPSCSQPTNPQMVIEVEVGVPSRRWHIVACLMHDTVAEHPNTVLRLCKNENRFDVSTTYEAAHIAYKMNTNAR